MSGRAGMNRTGMGMSPLDAGEVIRAAEAGWPQVGGDSGTLSSLRGQYIQDAEQIGTLPPPTTLKFAAHTAANLVRGKNANVLVDRLGQRMAFERTGVRLYEALLIKLDAMGSWQGGPSAADVVRLHDEERAHFELAKTALEELGADPTAQTPAADVGALACAGIVQVVTDSRTSLAQCLDAMLMAELAGGVAWDVLAELAALLRQPELAEACGLAHARKTAHAATVRAWLTAYLWHDANAELGVHD